MSRDTLTLKGLEERSGGANVAVMETLNSVEIMAALQLRYVK
jgi:hypothetical protein